jgi:uncharacterized damage-inducible protein DinB
MSQDAISLAAIFDGWDGYHTSILHALEPLTPEQLAWRPVEHERSVGETVGHIALGRIGWFSRMEAPLSLELLKESEGMILPGGDINPARATEPALLVYWLNRTWEMVDATLHAWTVADLSRSFVQPYQGKVYRCSFQWALWRILSHDILHGGQLSLMLGMQGIPVPELGDLGGHLTVPPIIED